MSAYEWEWLYFRKEVNSILCHIIFILSVFCHLLEKFSQCNVSLIFCFCSYSFRVGNRIQLKERTDFTPRHIMNVVRCSDFKPERHIERTKMSNGQKHRVEKKTKKPHRLECARSNFQFLSSHACICPICSA